MDPRLGIDTSGPGEAVFAIRFNGKPQFVLENLNFRTRTKLGKIRTFPIRTFWGVMCLNICCCLIGSLGYDVLFMRSVD